LICLTLPLDVYFGYLDWQVHREKKAIQFLRANGTYVTTYDTTPRWAKVIFQGRAAWPWERADRVNMGGYKDIPQFMAAVGNLKFLRHLSLPITDADFATIKGLTALQSLDLAYASITDADLENLNGLPALQELGLDHTHVTDAGLANLKGLLALQSLDLSYTVVTNAGLVNLKGLTALQTLDLSCTQITDAGLVNLKGLTTLKKLNLDDTSVTDMGLADLKGLKALRELDLGGTWCLVTDAGVAELQKSLPNCHIYR
jgi:hypothetical protein